MRWQWVAKPGGRRQHQGLIPRLGGLPVFGGLMVGIGVIFWLLPLDSTDAGLFQGVILGSLVVFAGGFLDDIFDLPPWFQFAIQIAGAAVALNFEVFIERFTNPLPSGALWTSGPMSLFFSYEEPPIVVIRPFLIWLPTVFWVVGMMNTVNWLDGLDGLAVGVGTIAACMFAWHSYQLAVITGQFTAVAFPVALAGALLGFLPFNFAPARIFLGSAGAYLLGYQLAALAIISPAKIATALLVLAVPILDVAWQIINRIRRGHNPLRGDRGHLHFRLSDSGFPTRLIVLGYYTAAATFGLVAIFAPTPSVKLIMLVALGTAVMGLLIRLSE